MKYLSIALILAFLCLFVSCKTKSVKTDKIIENPVMVTTPSGLQYYDIIIGKGASPKIGKKITINYIGSLEDGTQFENSYENNKPLTFTYGETPIIKGLEEGLLSMKKGGKRKMIISPDLGYGNMNVGKIPANSTLIYEVELVDVK